jgi:hypothetical protein
LESRSPESRDRDVIWTVDQRDPSELYKPWDLNLYLRIREFGGGRPGSWSHEVRVEIRCDPLIKEEGPEDMGPSMSYRGFVSLEVEDQALGVTKSRVARSRCDLGR